MHSEVTLCLILLCIVSTTVVICQESKEGDTGVEVETEKEKAEDVTELMEVTTESESEKESEGKERVLQPVLSMSSTTPVVENGEPEIAKTSAPTTTTTTSTTTTEPTTITRVSSTTPQATEPTKEVAPPDVFPVRSSDGEICLLAKLHAEFKISYASNDGEEPVIVDLPPNAKVKGRCGSKAKPPLLQLTWDEYGFNIAFSKVTDDDSWYVTSMELAYDTSNPLFDQAINVGKKTARSKELTLFETPFGKSYFCPSPEVVLLFTGNKQVASVRLRDVYLQPYDVKKGKFSTVHRCNLVVIGGPDDEPFVQDETVPLAVGCTLAIITLIVLVGFSVHRAYNAAKVDYNSME